MSASYITEPPPTASVLLQTTAGPLTLSIFASQTPLASRNFLQHVLDGYYDNSIFHRVSPGFVIQTGDPSGTGAGGTSIYEAREFERYDALWARELGREAGEKINFGDEIHSRLKFSRRGLVGMAKMGDGDGYGSQFFITLGDCQRELNGKATMFGRVEGDGIYNIVKIAEGELVEGTERPVFPEKILYAEVLEMPKGEAWKALSKRKRAAIGRIEEEERPKKMVKREKKGGKALLSFGDEDGEEGVGLVVKSKRAKFNTALIDGGDIATKEKPRPNGTTSRKKSPPPARQKETSPPPKREAKAAPQPALPSSSRSPEISHRRKLSFHDSTTQFPIRNPEVPSRSLSTTPEPESKPSNMASLNAEIAALKASMRRDTGTAADAKKKKSALEQMIPATSTRGRKRPRPGDTNGGSSDASALKILNSFRARLDHVGAEKMDVTGSGLKPNKLGANGHVEAKTPLAAADDDEEAALCDLHFIANCQSCSKWDEHLEGEEGGVADDDNDGDWMGHALSFEKDRLGKDLTWRRKGEEELVVIDPREKEKNIKREMKEKRKGRS